MIIDDNSLDHSGVKGMKWGVRKSDKTPRSTDRMARKDAQEAARAKMFYGEGAGTRRKLINKSVEDKKKRDPAYAKAFDRHLANQKLDVHASKAIKERGRADFKKRNKQRGGAVLRRVTGEPGTQAALVAATIAGGAFLSRPQNRAMMKQKASSIINSAKVKRNAAKINYFLKKHGINTP